MAGLFGPQSSSTSSHVQSICDTLEIPHIETRWDYRMKREDYSVNLYPHPLALGQESIFSSDREDVRIVILGYPLLIYKIFEIFFAEFIK